MESIVQFNVVLWASIQLAIILVVCIYLLRGYTDRKQTSIFIQIVVVIGWFLSFSIIVFIPLDIYLNEEQAQKL